MTQEPNDSVHMQYIIDKNKQPYQIGLVAQTAIDCDDAEDYLSRQDVLAILQTRAEFDNVNISQLEDTIKLSIHNGDDMQKLFLAVPKGYGSDEVTTNLRYWDQHTEHVYFLDDQGNPIYADRLDPEDPISRVLEGVSRDVYNKISLMESEFEDDDDISPDDVE